MPFPWGAAIAAGGQVAGGLLNMFGGKKDNYHPEVWRNDAYKNYIKQIQGVRDASKQFGFHPLTLMGSQMQAPGVYALGGDTGQSRWGDFVGDAFGSAGALYQQDAELRDREAQRAIEQSRYDDARFDRILEDQAQSKRDTLNEQLIRAQLEEVRSRTMLNAARARAVGGPQPMGTDPVRLTDAFGDTLLPTNTGSQEFADQYGDIIGEVYGIGNWIRDTWNFSQRNRVPVDLGSAPGGSAIVGGPQP